MTANIVALDQENHGLAVVINGEETYEISSIDELELPAGGGMIVADGNVWGVSNGLSISQFVFSSLDQRSEFLVNVSEQGYKSLAVSNKYARTQYLSRGYSQQEAVRALYDAVREQVDKYGRFDSGKPVRESRGDISFGERTTVTQDFLRIQNSSGYESKFLENAIKIAWDSLDDRGKKLFNLQMRTPKCTSANRISAVLACTHDPMTGERRMYNGKPWGVRFITRNVLGLNGMMMGTGPLSPGNPMRAVLRILGRRWGDKVNAEERAALDRYVKILVRSFQKYDVIPVN